MVGCVIAHGAEIIGEGWHRRFGGDHAEVEALRLAGPRAARGHALRHPRAVLPPRQDAPLHPGRSWPPASRRVVAAMRRPLPPGRRRRPGGTAGRPAWKSKSGLLEDEARRLNAPYLKLIQRGRPWIIAKWAMTLDGKIATRSGREPLDLRPRSRQVVHALRGRVDAIVVGRETAVRDDPLLTARPPGPRTPLRIVLDTRASLPRKANWSARRAKRRCWSPPGARRPRPIAGGCARPAARCSSAPAATHAARLDALLDELGSGN